MSEYFITKNVANMMKEPNPDSVLDSQVVAGTIVTVEERENDYCYVKTPDLYHGWVAQRRLVEVWDRSAYESACVKSLFAPVYAKPDETSFLLTQLVISTRVFFTKETGNFVEIILPDKQIAYVPKTCLVDWQDSGADKNIFEEKWLNSTIDERIKIITDLGEKVVKTAMFFMGTPYLWGGNTPFGMDCSGMTQLVYGLHGLQLSRNSYMQFDDKRFNKIETGKALDEAILQAGDLLVFDIKQKGKVDHIGIACGDDTFIQTRGEMLGNGMVIDQCADAYYKKVYIGACRLSASADVNICAS